MGVIIESVRASAHGCHFRNISTNVSCVKEPCCNRAIRILACMFPSMATSWSALYETQRRNHPHDSDVIMGAMASQITSLTIVYSTVYSCADKGKHQSSESPAFVRGIHRSPVSSQHKWPVTRKMFPFDDVIMHKQKPWLPTKICRSI